MKIEDQVCSFEQARTLEILVGLKKSIWYWAIHENSGKWDLVLGDSACHGYYAEHKPAYTVAELGVLLGKYFIMRLISERWALVSTQTERIFCTFSEYSPENIARADALIWLIKNGKINPGDLKL